LSNNFVAKESRLLKNVKKHDFPGGKMSKMSKLILKEENLINRKYFIRGEKVMFDFDLALLYDVENRALKQAVKRNIERFPNDFMFELTENEIENMVSQFVIPSKSKLGSAVPMAFSEQGVAMLSSVLKSKKALQVNIAIMRTFVKIRKLMSIHKDLAEKIEKLEKKYDGQFKEVFDLIKKLIVEKEKPERPMEFTLESK
jgi:hypothetical protein